MLRNLARPFVGLGRKLGNLFRLGRKVAPSGVLQERVLSGGGGKKFINLPIFEPSGNKNLLRGSDYMIGNRFMGGM